MDVAKEGDVANFPTPDELMGYNLSTETRRGGDCRLERAAFCYSF